MYELPKACRVLEKRIGYRFRKRALLVTALTHPSFCAESCDNEESNQRLEFLGDAVIDFLLAAALFDHFENEPEGVLTSLRSQLSNGQSLAELAGDLALGDLLRLGKGEAATGGRTRPSTLADALEAVVGAAYLDGGLRAARKVFMCIFGERLAALDGDIWSHNPKGRLQELAQQRWKKPPVYRLLGQEGPAHAMCFEVAVFSDGRELGRGTGSSKQQAEQAAATDALRVIGEG